MLEKAGRALAIRFDQPGRDSESINERLGKLAGTLSQLANIQEQSDWIYLADILEYELVPEMETLRDFLPNLLERAH